MRTRRSTMTAGRTDQALPAVRRRAAAGVRALQRSAGNQALAALIRRQATPDIQRDDVRPPEMKNDVWMGDDEGPLALPGHKFISDPYDHTVVVVNPDGTGVQYTYEIVQTDSGPREKLYHTEKLSKMRVDALARLDKAAPGETQEDTGGPGRRKKADHAEGEKERRKWEKAHPAEFAEYQAKLAAYQAALDARSDEEKKKKPPPPPPAPKGYPADKKTTLCTNWPGAVYHSAGGSEKQSFPFTPPTDLPAWRTLDKHPEGPRPGDIYYLWDTDLNRAAHMGVFKSAAPIPGKAPLMRWVVSDGGQGSYEKVQMIYERSRTFNPTTGMFLTEGAVAEAGQDKGNRRLVGWIDIEAQAGQQSSAVST